MTLQEQIADFTALDKFQIDEIIALCSSHYEQKVVDGVKKVPIRYHYDLSGNEFTYIKKSDVNRAIESAFKEE